LEILVDPMLRSLRAGMLPDDWATRAIFSYPSAAAMWELRSMSPEALEAPQEVLGVYALFAGTVATDWDYFISLGAGAGVVDRAVLSHIRKPTTYVPIDLTADMCALAEISLRGMCEIPFGIVADLENRLDFVGSVLPNKPGSARLFSCTGNMLGNLDLGEENFLANIGTLMRPGDYLMLSVATGSFDRPIDRRRFEETVGWEDLSDLLAAGISMTTSEDVGAARRSLTKRIDVGPGSSDVPGAGAVQLIDRDCGRVLLHMRRYEFLQLNAWIEARFPVVNLRSADVPVSPQVGIGTSIFRKYHG
jgi:Histidine-specific methyltransferase, SAM-dependent